MRQRWSEVILFIIPVISMTVALAYFVGWLALPLAAAISVGYLLFLDRLERKRGTISATTEQQEV